MSEKRQPLTVYLLKTDVKAYDEALVDLAGLEELRIKDQLEFEGVAYYKKSRALPPNWAGFVQAIVADDVMTVLRSQHSSLILFVKASSRLFAVVFGYGRSFLNPSSYVRDFGLKVVLNAVDPDKLRCVDTNSLEEIPVSTRQQASKVSALELFDIDRETEMMKALVGIPRPGVLRSIELGGGISGSACLSLGIKAKAESLAKVCSGLLSLYKRKDYQKNGFDWVDNLRPVSDPNKIVELDEELLTVLKRKDEESVHLAPSEIINWDSVEGFWYSTDRHRKRKLFPDIEIADFYSVAEHLFEMSRAELLRVNVGLNHTDDLEHVTSFRLYECIVFDVEKSGIRYVLTDGLWFEVDKDFSGKVESCIEQIAEANLDLPNATTKEMENEFTIKACSANADFALMDRKCVVPTGARANNPIEVCDIFTRNRQFVHIKPYKASSTLSHLFAQGTVSADLFQNDVGFRMKAKERIAEASKAIAGIFPDTKTPNPKDYEIVYAIIKKDNDVVPWQKSLPFFAKLNLRQASIMLSNRGYKVAVKLIPRD